jgi:hypothetical protein
MKNKKPVKLVNLRNRTEVWLCEDYSNRRQVDGEEFVQVYKPEAPARQVWVNIKTLEKTK